MSYGDVFSLVLFSTVPSVIRAQVSAGVDTIIVDWENRDKERRQRTHDTQINRDSPEDLANVRASTDARVICRLDRPGPWLTEQLEAAIKRGADEVLLPMITGPDEVIAVLDQARGRVQVGILVETEAAVEQRVQLAALDLSRVYVGLNDLAVARRAPCIFSAVADGTVERVREAFSVPFGFGGLTLPEHGAPIICRLLIAEMARLDCQFSFLRRAYHASIAGRDPGREVPRIRAALTAAAERNAGQVAADQSELQASIRELEAAPVTARLVP